MKAWTIAIKDTLISFRDRNAILLMIAAPLMIGLVMGAAFGGQSDDISPISEIPLAIVNQDEGDLGATFVEIVTSIDVETAEGTKGLFAVTEMSSKEDAIALVESGEIRGVLFIPAAFSAAVETQSNAPLNIQIEVYTDPSASVSPGIIRGVTQRIANSFNTALIGNRIAVEQLLATTTNIAVVVVNSDPGPLGAAFTDAFSSANFADVFNITTTDNLAAARADLDAGRAQSVIHVTEAFSQVVMAGGNGAEIAAALEFFGDGSLSAPIVENAARQVAAGFSGDASDNVEVSGVLANLENLDEIIRAENASFSESEGARERIRIDLKTLGASEKVDLLGYFVPSMSIFFLMFAAFEGTRSILEEERDGTLHRLMTTPTSVRQILLGKIGGTFLTGILQFVVLVVSSSLLFNVHWADNFIPLVAMTFSTVFAATSLGAFLASFARNANQAGAIGATVNLIFAILGGNFVLTVAFPDWLTFLSKLTVNRWAVDGFAELALSHGGLTDILPNIGVLLGMALVYFLLSAALFKRRFVQ